MGLFGRKYLIDHPERFDSEEREVIALTESDPRFSRLNIDNNRYWSSNVPLIGYIDCASGELITTRCFLTWNYRDEKSIKNRFRIGKFGIYRLRVRFSGFYTAPWGAEFPAGRTLFVTKVVRRNVSEPRLEEMLEEYKKPVFIELSDNDRLELNRLGGAFEGEIKWLDSAIDVSLDADSDSDSCEGALEHFSLIYNNAEEWERRVKQFLVKELLESANDWQSGEADYKPITAEEFAERTELCCLNISSEGDLEFWFSDDGIFFEHSIVAYGNIEKGFSEANLVG